MSTFTCVCLCALPLLFSQLARSGPLLQSRPQLLRPARSPAAGSETPGAPQALRPTLPTPGRPSWSLSSAGPQAGAPFPQPAPCLGVPALPGWAEWRPLRAGCQSSLAPSPSWKVGLACWAGRAGLAAGWAGSLAQVLLRSGPLDRLPAWTGRSRCPAPSPAGQPRAACITPSPRPRCPSARPGAQANWGAGYRGGHQPGHSALHSVVGGAAGSGEEQVRAPPRLSVRAPPPGGLSVPSPHPMALSPPHGAPVFAVHVWPLCPGHVGTQEWWAFRAGGHPGQLGTQTFLGTRFRTDTVTLPVGRPWLCQVTSLAGVAGIPGLSTWELTPPAACPQTSASKEGPCSNPLKAQRDPPPGEVGGAALCTLLGPGAQGPQPGWACLAVGPQAPPVPRASPCGGPAPGGSLHARGLLPLPKVVPGLPDMAGVGSKQPREPWEPGLQADPWDQ